MIKGIVRAASFFIITVILSANYWPAQALNPTIEAPFGLTWGAPIINFTNLSKCKKLKNTYRICRAKSLPQGFKDAKEYWLVFNENGELVKIRYVSKTITQDRFGIEGKERFINLKARLSVKYNKIPQRELISMYRDLYTKVDEFYQCLNYDGCGYYYFFIGNRKSNSGTVMIKLNGAGRGKGYLSVEYASVNFLPR